MGNQPSRPAKIMSRTAAAIKLGRLMPARTSVRLSQSNTPPRFTAAVVPIASPNTTAITSENNPSVMEIGNSTALRRMSFTDHSGYCMLGPKSPVVMICVG